MTINDILTNIKNTSGKNDKVALLKEGGRILGTLFQTLFQDLLRYTYNPYKQYYMVKVPKVKGNRDPMPEENQWTQFFALLDLLDHRKLSGNLGIHEMVKFFSLCSLENEGWMRKVLKRHLNIGITSKSINKAFPALIPTFDVQLAHNFDNKRVKSMEIVALEPKYDGVRCIVVVKDGNVQLLSRKGKSFEGQPAFEQTVIPELAGLDDGVFDGEFFGVDFKTTIEVVRRGSDFDMDKVRKVKFHMWDWMPYGDWVKQSTDLTCQASREVLEDMSINSRHDFLRLVQRDLVHPSKAREYHDRYVMDTSIAKAGFEGAMVKLLDTTYKFGRGHNVMKYKHFYTDDFKVVGFEEGVGKYEAHLGALIIERPHEGQMVRVGVGTGFSDDERLEIWENRSKYRDKTAEVKYFEVTPDGSLRFTVFVQWRFDK